MRVKNAIDKKTVPKHFRSNLRVLFAERRRPPFECSINLNESKRKATARRSEELQKQAPENLIRFMIAYPPTVWEGQRTMRDGDFQRLLVASKPEPDLLTAPFIAIILRELQTSNLSKQNRFERLMEGETYSAIQNYRDSHMQPLIDMKMTAAARKDLWNPIGERSL